MSVVTDRLRVWRCFYHLPFLWLFDLDFQYVCSKLHSLTIIHHYLILSLVSFSYFIFTSLLFILLFFLFLIVFSYSKRFMRHLFHLYSVSYMFPIKNWRTRFKFISVQKDLGHFFELKRKRGHK